MELDAERDVSLLPLQAKNITSTARALTDREYCFIEMASARALQGTLEHNSHYVNRHPNPLPFRFRG